MHKVFSHAAPTQAPPAKDSRSLERARGLESQRNCARACSFRSSRFLPLNSAELPPKGRERAECRERRPPHNYLRQSTLALSAHSLVVPVPSENPPRSDRSRFRQHAPLSAPRKMPRKRCETQDPRHGHVKGY